MRKYWWHSLGDRFKYTWQSTFINTLVLVSRIFLKLTQKNDLGMGLNDRNRWRFDRYKTVFTRDVNICDRKWFKRQDLLIIFMLRCVTGTGLEQIFVLNIRRAHCYPFLLIWRFTQHIKYLERPPFRTNKNSGYHYFKIIVVFGQKVFILANFWTILGLFD